MDCYPFTIIGGGVAGLAAANRLADLGHRPLVLEASSYPKEVVCGQFLSSSALQLLHDWDIHPSVEIDSTTFYSQDRPLFSLPFKNPGGMLSRTLLEEKLLQRALSKGAVVKTHAKVTKITPGEPFQIDLEEGSLQTSKLLVSAGRFHNSRQKPCYVGMSAHFDQISLPKKLYMHLIDGGYVGIAPISDRQINVALICRKEPKLPDSVQALLDSGTICGPGWLRCELPPFQDKEVPPWPNSYFFGDALTTIPPITGMGLTLALYSAHMAATKASLNQPMCRQFQRQLTIGRLLHKTALRAPSLVSLFGYLPKLASVTYKLIEVPNHNFF